MRARFVRNNVVQWPEEPFDGRPVDRVEFWTTGHYLGPDAECRPDAHCGDIPARACPGAEALGWHDGVVYVIDDTDPAVFVAELAWLFSWACHRGTLHDYVSLAASHLGSPHGVGRGAGYPVHRFRWMAVSYMLRASHDGRFDPVAAVRKAISTQR